MPLSCYRLSTLYNRFVTLHVHVSRFNAQSQLQYVDQRMPGVTRPSASRGAVKRN